jgi:hypothetical protein
MKHVIRWFGRYAAASTELQTAAERVAFVSGAVLATRLLARFMLRHRGSLAAAAIELGDHLPPDPAAAARADDAQTAAMRAPGARPADWSVPED